MAHSDAGSDGYHGGWRPRRAATVGRRLGGALVGAALPALAVTIGVAVAQGKVADPLSWVQAAMATAVVGGGGIQWAFHVAAVTGLAGVWAIGFALVVEGYFGLE